MLDTLQRSRVDSEHSLAKNPHAVALGRRGGLASKGKTSPAKAKASRENGRKGGRHKPDSTK